MKDYFALRKPVHFVFPIDGDCLNQYDGTEKNGKLVVRALVAAAPDADIYINEEKAFFNGKYFEADLTLDGRRNTFFAEDMNCRENCDRIAVYDVRHSVGKYRISSDDNILFLQDITKNQDTYRSIFENPYLAVYKEAHDKFNAKVHLNLFYETDEMPGFAVRRDYFNLSMMTDKFKAEWEANSDWLHLSFHAHQEFPDKPYQHTTMKRITEDARKINAEILRFAGAKTLASVCTVHWGEANIGGVRALRALGYRGLTGYFEFFENGDPLVAYYYPKELISHVGGRDFWMNTEEDVMHGRIDLVLNTIKYEDLLPRLESIKADPHRSGFMELMIHEQYFHSDYTNYIPKFRDLVLDAAKWAYDYGSRGALMDEVMFE